LLEDVIEVQLRPNQRPIWSQRCAPDYESGVRSSNLFGRASILNDLAVRHAGSAYFHSAKVSAW